MRQVRQARRAVASTQSLRFCMKWFSANGKALDLVENPLITQGLPQSADSGLDCGKQFLIPGHQHATAAAPREKWFSKSEIVPPDQSLSRNGNRLSGPYPHTARNGVLFPGGLAAMLCNLSGLCGSMRSGLYRRPGSLGRIHQCSCWRWLGRWPFAARWRHAVPAAPAPSLGRVQWRAQRVFPARQAKSRQEMWRARASTGLVLALGGRTLRVARTRSSNQAHRSHRCRSASSPSLSTPT